MKRVVTARGHVVLGVVMVGLALVISFFLLWNGWRSFADPPRVFVWVGPNAARLIYIMGFISVPPVGLATVNHGVQVCGATAVVYGWETAEGPFLGTWMGRIGVRRRRLLLDGPVTVRLGREPLRGNRITDKIRPRFIELRRGDRTLVFRSFAPLGLKRTQDSLGDWFGHHQIKFSLSNDVS
jgi:hypothetical protein